MQVVNDSNDIESQTLLTYDHTPKHRYGLYIYNTLLFGMVGVTTFYTIYSYYTN